MALQIPDYTKTMARLKSPSDRAKERFAQAAAQQDQEQQGLTIEKMRSDIESAKQKAAKDVRVRQIIASGQDPEATYHALLREDTEIANDYRTQQQQQAAARRAEDIQNANMMQGRMAPDLTLPNRSGLAPNPEDHAPLPEMPIRSATGGPSMTVQPQSAQDMNLTAQAKARFTAAEADRIAQRNQADELEKIRMREEQQAKYAKPAAVSQPSSIAEYNLYKQEGGKLGFDAWQTKDANLKKVQPPAAQRDRVIQTPTGPQLLDMDSGVSRPITDQGGAAIPLAPTTDTRNREMALKRIDPVLTKISDLSEKINTGKGLLAKVSGAVEKAKAQANYNDDVALYQSVISGFTPLVARASGHTGVLTQQDVDSVRELFPKPGDSKTLRDRKIANVKEILAGAPPDTGTAGVPSVGGTFNGGTVTKVTKIE